MAAPRPVDAWYLIQTKPREDKRAFENLINQSFRCYQPLRMTRKRQAGKIIECEEPLFPSYLFIRLSSVDDNWFPIRSTRGVIRLVRFGETPAKIPDTAIEQIRMAESQVFSTPQPLFAPGQAIQIVNGPFKGVDGIFVEEDAQKRICVLFDFMQKQHRIALPAEAVAAR